MLSILLSIIAANAYAQFGGGSGTAGDPYLISSVIHLNNIRGASYLGMYYKQSIDLNLGKTNPANVSDWVSGTNYAIGDYVKYTPSSIQYTYICIQATNSINPSNASYWTQMWESSKGWKPIGDATNVFHGVYDGNGKTIANLYINRGASPTADNVYPSDGEDNIGLFGYVANGSTAGANNFHATIKSLGILNPNVTGRRATGSLVGRVLLPETTPARSYTVYIEKCYAEASGGGSATVKGFGATGGLVGANNSNAKQRVPIIRFCYAKVNVSATHPNNTTRNPNDYTGSGGIYNPYNIKYGGLVGCNENGVTQDSFARGNVSGGDRVGGLAGCTIGGAIFRSYSTGTVAQGIAPGDWQGGIGGLVGRTSGTLPPGLGGTNSTGSCEDCFWDTETSGYATSPGGTGRTTTQMKTQSTFTNWDFVNVWGIDAGINDGYPYLRGNASTEFYYRSKQTGNWNNTGTWEYSADQSTWNDAVVTPDRANSISILIRNTHTVTVTQHVIIDGTNVESGGKILIDPAVSLDVSNGIGDDLTVNGSLEVQGTLYPESNSNLVFNSGSFLIYSGSTAQSTGTYFLDPVYNLTINNASGVTFTNLLTINGVLKIESGFYSAANDPAVDGYHAPIINYLEIGETGSNIAGFAATTGLGSYLPTKINRYWTLTGSYSGSKTLTFHWTNSDDNNYDWTGKTPAAFNGPTKYTGSSVTVSGINRYFSVSVPSQITKGIWTVGLDNEQTLPVELSSFTASLNSYNNIQLQWVTQSETNVSGFRIYRSYSPTIEQANMLNVFIPATNTSVAQLYQYTDTEQTQEGIYYYWLENVDLDGSSGFHGPVSVSFSYPETASPGIPLVEGINSIFPNPFNPNTTVRFGVSKDQKTVLSIYNKRGQLVRRLFDASLAKGTYNVHWDGRDDNGKQVASGIYLLRLNSGSDSYSAKLMLMK